MSITDKIINYFKGIKPACEGLGLTNQAFWLWRKYGVPVAKCFMIEDATKGSVKAIDVFNDCRERRERK